MKKIISIMVVIMMMTLAFAGCGKKDDKASSNQVVKGQDKSKESSISKEVEKKPVTLTFLTNVIDYPKNNDAINEALHKVYPNISVDIIHVADNYDAVLKTKINSGEAPDLFNYPGYLGMKPFVEADQVLDLTDDKLDELVFESFRDSGRYNGKLYAIPTQVISYGLIYNKDALADAGVAETPRTLSELETAITKFNDAGITPFASGFKDIWLSYHMFWAMQGSTLDDFYQFHSDMNEGNTSFKNNKLDKTFELLNMYIENAGDKPLSSDFSNMCHLVGTKKAAMAIQGVWAYNETIKLDPEVKLGLAPIPVSEDPNEATLLADADGFMFISSDTKHPEEAKDFIRWMLSKEGVEATVALLGQQSPSVANPEIELNALCADAADWIKAGNRTRGFMINFWPSGLADIIGKDMQSYIAGGITLDELYNDIDSEWKKLSGN